MEPKAILPKIIPKIAEILKYSYISQAVKMIKTNILKILVDLTILE